MNIFDLEQEIMRCWNMVDDVKDTASYIQDGEQFQNMSPEHVDALANLLSGISHTYEMRFQKLWKTFEAHCSDHHRLRRAEKQYEQINQRIVSDHDFPEEK